MKLTIDINDKKIQPKTEWPMLEVEEVVLFCIISFGVYKLLRFNTAHVL